MTEYFDMDEDELMLWAAERMSDITDETVIALKLNGWKIVNEDGCDGPSVARRRTTPARAGVSMSRSSRPPKCCRSE
jgi:hypothetical protein